MSGMGLGDIARRRDDLASGAKVEGGVRTLVTVIPTEALAVYTAFTGTVLASDIGNGYGPFRWWAYAVFVLLAFLVPLGTYRRRASTAEGDAATARQGKSRRATPVPLLECAVAAFAAAAWGLVTPGSPLGIELTGDTLLLTTTAITLGSVAVLALVTIPLTEANEVRATAHAADPDGDDGRPASLRRLDIHEMVVTWPGGHGRRT